MASSVQTHQETQSETQVSNWSMSEKKTKSESSIHGTFPWKIGYEYQNYVCLVDNIMGNKSSRNASNQHDSDKVEEEVESDPVLDRSEARHNLDLKGIDINESQEMAIDRTSVSTDSEANKNKESDSTDFLNPEMLKLTRMRWLTDKCHGFPELSPSLSPTISSTSSDFSQESLDDLRDISERPLNTILNLDREHKMFGISDIFIVGALGKTRKNEDDGPVFPQTAIVQVCLECCKHKSITDLPSSLKCERCYSCTSCTYPLCPPYPSTCGSCISTQGKPVRPICKSSLKCVPDCPHNIGFTITVDKKPEVKLSHVEITPRSSCVLSKPLAARSCHHCPPCVPPSSCFPYLAPCFWPTRPSAPCPTPTRCFHNPPCLPKRQRKSPKDPHTACPKLGSCKDNINEAPDPQCPNKYEISRKDGCANPICPGKIPGFKEAIKNKYEIRESTVRYNSLTK